MKRPSPRSAIAASDWLGTRRSRPSRCSRGYHLPHAARRRPSPGSSRRASLTAGSSARGRRKRYWRELESRGIAGGAVYDALVGATAIDHGCTLATRDRRAVDTYRLRGECRVAGLRRVRRSAGRPSRHRPARRFARNLSSDPRCEAAPEYGRLAEQCARAIRGVADRSLRDARLRLSQQGCSAAGLPLRPGRGSRSCSTTAR